MGRFIISFLILFLFFSGCIKPQDTPYKTSELVPTFSVTLYSSTVVCGAGFIDGNDTSGVLVPLESDAIVACNESPMDIDPTTSFYFKALGYLPGQKYTITVFRPKDGSTLVYSAYVD